MTTEPEKSSWETETGLPNDVDGWITNSRFGKKEEYASKVQESTGGQSDGTMFLVDLVDEAGELIGSQGYSIGTGWIISDDGLEISHPKRVNVVTNTLYGQLQNRVRKELGVEMEKRGLPTQAKAWDGLGFHWLIQEHDVVAGGQKPGLMPVEYLGEKKIGARPTPAAAPAATKVAVSADLETKLKEIAQQTDVKEFQKQALKVPEVTANDELMASVLEEGPAGFWATHQ